jgi:hypothetical protein
MTETPKPGDAVVMWDPFQERQRLGVIDSSEAYGDGLLMVVVGASAFRPRSHPDHVSCSGGPCPALDPDTLSLVGTREQRFWDWKDVPRAGGGYDYTETVNLWAHHGTI